MLSPLSFDDEHERAVNTGGDVEEHRRRTFSMRPSLVPPMQSTFALLLLLSPPLCYASSCTELSPWTKSDEDKAINGLDMVAWEWFVDSSYDRLIWDGGALRQVYHWFKKNHRHFEDRNLEFRAVYATEKRKYCFRFLKNNVISVKNETLKQEGEVIREESCFFFHVKQNNHRSKRSALYIATLNHLQQTMELVALHICQLKTGVVNRSSTIRKNNFNQQRRESANRNP